MAGKYGKHLIEHEKFVEEACNFLELSKLAESLGVGHIKLSEQCFGKSEACTCNKTKRDLRKKSRKAAEDQTFVSWPNSKARRQTTGRNRASLGKSRTARNGKKNTELKTCTFNLKDISKEKLQSLKAEVKKDIKHQHRQAIKRSHKRQTLPPTSKKDKKTSVKENVKSKQLIASSLNLAKCMQLYLYKDLSKHDSVRLPSVELLPKTKYSKCSLNTWKSLDSLFESLAFNNVDKQKTNKRETTDGFSKRKRTKPLDTNPSLQLNMKLRIEPNSNALDLRIKTRQETSKAAKKNPDAMCVAYPLKCDTPAHQELISRLKTINKLSSNFSTSVLTERSVTTPSAQTSNDREISLNPYAQTQVVYNVYDVSQHQPGQMRGLRSHISFNLDIGRAPQKPQVAMYGGQVYPLSAPASVGRVADRRQVRYNSQVNYGSGTTSLQQSVSLGRGGSQPGSPLSTSPYDSNVYSSQSAGSSFECTTCCRNNLFQRTRQRIVDRVGDGDKLFSPVDYFKKCYRQFIYNDEAQSKSVGSCTCSPFIETEQFAVQERHADPTCSFLKKCFDKFKCKKLDTTEKRVGTKYHKLKPFECPPGTCIEVKPSIFNCFKKLCKKKSIDAKKQKLLEAKKKVTKVKEKAKKQKEKAKKQKEKTQKRALAKVKKERDKKKKGRVKGTSSTSFVSSIFMNPEEDDDRQKLLSGKVKEMKGGSKEKGKEGGKSELGGKATKTAEVTRRNYRRLTRRIRERYYRNKRMAEEQKGQYSCDFYLMSLRTRPCLWVYYLCPVCYPYTLQVLNTWKQVSDLLLFFLAIIVWSPCILCAECLKVVACNMCG